MSAHVKCKADSMTVLRKITDIVKGYKIGHITIQVYTDEFKADEPAEPLTEA